MTIKLKKISCFVVFKDGMDATDLHRGHTFLTENTIFLPKKKLSAVNKKIDPSNYRGISLLFIVWKIFTKLLKSRFVRWEDENGLRH